MTSTSCADLDRWLNQATQGVPQQWTASIRAELTAHFEDTVTGFLQQNVPEEIARQRALSALGDPHTVAHGFNDVHRGRRHYLLAALACVLLLIENFDLPQRFLMPDWADGSAPSRIFYAADHAFTILLALYVVFVMGRLLVWRFDSEAANTPVNIILGGLVAHLLGTVIFDLAFDTEASVPTLLNASNLIEGLAALLQNGGISLSGIGFVILGVSVLPTLNRLGQSIAVVTMFEGAATLLYVITLYLDESFLYVNLLLVLSTMILLPVVGLVFLRAWISYHRLPAQTA